MKTIVKMLMIIGAVGTLISCKTAFNASEALGVKENRSAVYQEIISSPNHFSEFIDLAQKNEGAQKILMQKHMQKMESGNMKMMLEKNPEMKEKMESHMQKMMEKNPEMMHMMQSKMLGKMMETEKGRKMLLDAIHNNEMMKMEMKNHKMHMMKENHGMMEEKMHKMKGDNPDMLKKRKDKMHK